MRKYAIILAAALFAGTLSGCDEEKTLPYIPVEEPEDNTPSSGENPDTYTVTYRLDKVLQCTPESPKGADIFGKLDCFPTMRMTLDVSPLKTTATFDNGAIPFYPFDQALFEGPIDCTLDNNVVPNVLRVKGTDTILATFEADGFTTSFQLDSKLLTYKYKFKSL